MKNNVNRILSVMDQSAPYLGYELTGPRPLGELLGKLGLQCVFFASDELVRELFAKKSETLAPDRDSVRIGSFAKEGRTLFFAEFVIQIHDGLLSHISFLFDHMPLLSDLSICADNIESIALQALKSYQEKHGGIL